MKKRVVLLAVLVLGVGGGDAGAAVKPGGTAIVVEDGVPDSPYQRWVNRARVPSVPGTITVAERAIPSPTHHIYGAFDASTRTIYIDPETPFRKGVFRHELGHAFDAFGLTPRDRRGMYPSGWHPEAFAEHYSTCSLAGPPKWRICKKIRKLGGRP